MRFQLASLLGLCAFAGLVQAQAELAAKILADAPECGAPCIVPLFTTGVCSLDDITNCICSNITLQSHLSACVQTSCNFADQVEAVAIEADLCVAYPKETRSNEVRLAAILCTAFVVPIVILRFYSRLTITKKLGIDDYMTLVALVAHMAVSGIEIASATMGFGGHYWHIKPEVGTILLQLFWVVQMLYIVIQTFTKLAILFFLARVFETRGFQTAVWLFASFLVSTCIAFVLVDIFQCRPIYAVWDRYLEGNSRYCVNMTAAGYALAALSVFQDLALLVLPIPWVYRLQMNFRKRILVFCLFGVGSFACVTSMIRMRYLVRFSNTLDLTWDNVDVVIWSVIEGFSALLCGSLPAIWPLVAPYFAPIMAWTSRITDDSKRSRTTDTAISYRLRQYPKNFTELDGSDHMLSLEQNPTDRRAGTPRSVSDDDDFSFQPKNVEHKTEIRSLT